MQVQPNKWSEAEFDSFVNGSLSLWREERISEPLEIYEAFFEQYRDAVETLLEDSVDLSMLKDRAKSYLLDQDLFYAFRYLTSPAISEDDLKLLANSTFSKVQLEEDPDAIARAVDVVYMGLDRNRFPWIAEMREPTESEKLAATIATTALIAANRVQTYRRKMDKVNQEESVKRHLEEDGGLNEVPARTINNLSQAPNAGEFCGESKVAGRKADIVIRLWDGRIMLCECKLSNSYTNSVKRLNNDAAVKAETWLNELGAANVVPCAILSGAYKTHNLMEAQERGLFIFWSHSLSPLISFINQTRQQ